MKAGDLLIIVAVGLAALVLIGLAVMVWWWVVIFADLGWRPFRFALDRGRAVSDALRRARIRAALRIGGKDVRETSPFEGELSRLDRIMRNDHARRLADMERATEPGPAITRPAPWTEDDRPQYIPPALWSTQFVGTFDPLPEPDAIRAVEGPGPIPGVDYDTRDYAVTDPDPSVVLPDECPGRGCPRQSGADPVQALAPNPVAMTSEGHPCCLVVYCPNCTHPNPTFLVLCGRCGHALKGGSESAPAHVQGDAAEQTIGDTAAGKWPFETAAAGRDGPSDFFWSQTPPVAIPAPAVEQRTAPAPRKRKPRPFAKGDRVKAGPGTSYHGYGVGVVVGKVTDRKASNHGEPLVRFDRHPIHGTRGGPIKAAVDSADLRRVAAKRKPVKAKA